MATNILLSPEVAGFRQRFASAAGNQRRLKDLRQEIIRVARDVDKQVDGGTLSAPAQATFDALYNMVGEINDALTRAEQLDAIEGAMARPRAKADQLFEAGLVEFPLHGMIMSRLGSPLPGIDLGQAIEQSAELERRANRKFNGFAAPLSMLAQRRRNFVQRDTISTTLPASGPGRNIIPLELDASRFIDALRAQPIVRQAGAQVISGLVGDLDIPKLKETGQVHWFTEGDRITQATQSFERVNFRPHHCGSYSAYSRNMMLQSTPDIQGIIIDDLQKLLFLDVDRVVLAGSGQGGEPLGIIRRSDVTKIEATQFSYLNNIELRAQLTGRNVPLDSCAYVGNSRIDAWSLSALDAMSRPLGKGLIYAGYNDFVSNVATAPALPGGTPPLPAVVNPLIFGAWSDIYITFWQELDVSPNEWADEFWFTGAVGIRVLMTMDANVRHSASFTWQDVTEGPALPPLISISPDGGQRAPAPAPAAAAHTAARPRVGAD